MSSETETVMKTIMERRSCRKYDKRPIPHDILERIVEAGRNAPTAMDMQLLRFYVVENPEVTQRIGMETYEIASKKVQRLVDRVNKMGLSNACTCDAPCCVVITVPSEAKDGPFIYMDVGLAVENMLVAAGAFGIRGLPVGLAVMFNESGILNIVGAGKDEKMMILLDLGYPDPEYDQKFRPEKTIKSVVHYI